MEFVKKYKEELNNNGVDSKEIVSLFIMYLDEEKRKFKLQKEEVSDIKWFTKIEMGKLIKDKKIIPHIEEYNLLKNILN
jgi:isopentenyldiphosphate isomerase